MNYEEFVYRDILVRLMKIRDLEGWYAVIKDQKYGNFIEINGLTKNNKPVADNDTFEILKENAKETINSILK